MERYPDRPNELYDEAHDPAEKFNLYGQSTQSKIQKELRAKLFTFFDRYADPKYDLWHGGESKTHLLSAGESRKFDPIPNAAPQ